MEFKGIKHKGMGEFIHRYDVLYETIDHEDKTYEIVSRDPDIAGYDELSRWEPGTVTIIGMSTDKKRILLNKEYRMAIGDWMYNFPSGLVDPGETPVEAAERELREETGLKFIKCFGRLKSSFNAPGLSNETSSCVFAIIDGDIRESDSSFEEIHACWFTKEDAKRLLKAQKMSARVQMFCFLWAYGGMSLDDLAQGCADTDVLQKYEP